MKGRQEACQTLEVEKRKGEERLKTHDGAELELPVLPSNHSALIYLSVVPPLLVDSRKLALKRSRRRRV